MKIQISDNLIRHYLRNVYFINGHSYAGKSTMVRMLAERYGMIHCGENYHDAFPREKLDRWKQPGLCYFDTMSGWPEWLNQTPEEHYRWVTQVSRECVEIEILELIKLAANGDKVIVDTNIPPDVLREISDYDHVAIMLCDPPDKSAPIRRRLCAISTPGRPITPPTRSTGRTRDSSASPGLTS